MKYYTIINPHGGLKKGLQIYDKIKPVFEAGGLELDVIGSTFAGHIRELAHQLDFDGYDGIIVIGGDGTMHEVVNGMLTRKDKKQLPIGLIPGGTGNSFMHDLDMLDPVKAAEAIVKGIKRKIDVAEIEVNHIKRYAFNIVGWGLATDIGKNAENFRWMGESRYTFTSVLEVLRHKARPAELVIDGKKIVYDYIFIIACNTIHTGKGMKIAPKAKLDDGLFDIVVVRHGMSKFALLQLLPKLFIGTHIEHPMVEYHQVSEFSLIPQKDEILNIDGELLGSTPINVVVKPKAFTVFANGEQIDG